MRVIFLPDNSSRSMRDLRTELGTCAARLDVRESWASDLQRWE